LKSQPNIHIIGAGLSGLAAAITLEKHGYKATILESSNSVGGRVKTSLQKGYHLDHGFQVMLDAYPKAKEFLDYKSLNLQKLLPGAVVFKNGRQYLIGDPLRSLSLLWPTMTFPLASLSDKLKVLKLNIELKKKSLAEIFSTEETTTQDYLENYGFSHDMISNFFKPFFTGIFLEPNLETSSRKFEFIYKMFGEGHAVIPKDGIVTISNQLHSKLKTTDVKFNNRVENISLEEITMSDGSILKSDYTIAATEASQLIPNLKNQKTDWKSCQCLYFECEDRVIDQPVIGLVADHDALINNLFYHTSIKGKPAKKELLSVTVVKNHNLSENELTDRVVSELSKYCKIAFIKHLKTINIPRGLPKLNNIRYDLAPSETQLTDQVFLAGDHTLNGSQNAALLSGQRAAEGIIEKIEGSGITGKITSEYL